MTSPATPIDALEQFLRNSGVAVQRDPDGLRMPAGFVLRGAWTIDRDQAGGYLLEAQVQVFHPSLLPQGVVVPVVYFGVDRDETETGVAAIWCRMALPALHDALSDTPELTHMLRQARADGTSWRVLLGPVVRLATEDAPSGANPHDAECPCCAFTNTMAAMDFERHWHGTRVVQAWALRLADGRSTAAILVDGVPDPHMAEALRAWVEKWPTQGDDERHQLWVVQA